MDYSTDGLESSWSNNFPKAHQLVTKPLTYDPVGYILDSNHNIIQSVTDALGKVWEFLIKLNIHLPYDQATPLLSIYAKELKTCLHKSCI
jgi:hypothetical protein